MNELLIQTCKQFGCNIHVRTERMLPEGCGGDYPPRWYWAFRVTIEPNEKLPCRNHTALPTVRNHGGFSATGRTVEEALTLAIGVMMELQVLRIGQKGSHLTPEEHVDSVEGTLDDTLRRDGHRK